MIRAYWPNKAIPSWLQKIEISEKEEGVTRIRHKGFGFIVKVKGRILVWHMSGYFIAIEGCRMPVKLTGQGRGVFIYLSFWPWISEIRQELTA